MYATTLNEEHPRYRDSRSHERESDFYAPGVVAFCQERGIEIMNDVQLLRKLTE
jgi:hypothetical protein